VNHSNDLLNFETNLNFRETAFLYVHEARSWLPAFHNSSDCARIPDDAVLRKYLMLIKIPSRDTAEVVGALSKHVRKLPAVLRRSLTWDRGLEMAKHQDFTVATDVQVYFCDPQSPWQRGSNENTNGLLRQYFPKNIDLTNYSQSDLNKVALRLNQRPRQTLGFQTPASKLQASVASTH
jgi:IS30 family transposase